MLLSSQFGEGAIKQVQRGIVVITGLNSSQTATLASMDVNKAECRQLGATVSTAPPAGTEQYGYIRLTNGTTLTATRGYVGGSCDLTQSYEVSERF